MISNNIPQAQPVDESMLRWKVCSLSSRRSNAGDPFEYFVELHNENGLNNCTCEHFQKRLKPHYTTAMISGVPNDKIKKLKCKHIRLAEESFKEIMLRKLAS